MKLKDIRKKVQQEIQKMTEENKEKSVTELLEEQVIQPTESEDLTNEEITQQQAENLVTVLQENPEIRETIVEEAAKSEQIPQEVIDESAKKAAENPKIPDSVAGTLVKQASDSTTVDILKNEGIASTKVRMDVIDSLEDQKKKEQAICNELEKVYKSLKESQPEEETAQKLQDILNLFGENEKTHKINEELNKTVAKVFASKYFYYNGSIKIFPLESIMPIDEMIRESMPQLIEKEYNKEYKDKRILKKKKPFVLSTVSEFFLERMVKKVMGEAIKENRKASLFMKDLGNLTETEQQYLRKEFSNLGIKDEELEKIMRIATGKEIAESTEYKPDSEEMSEKEKFFRGIAFHPLEQGKKQNDENAKKDLREKEYLSKKEIDFSTLNKEELEAIKQCIETGFIKTLVEIPENEREKTLKAVNASLEERVKTYPKLGETPEEGVIID